MQNSFDSRFSSIPNNSSFKKFPKHTKNQISLFKEINYDSTILPNSWLNLPKLLTFNKILDLNYNIFPEKIMILEENLNNLKNALILEDLFRIFSNCICEGQKVFTPKIETQFIDFFLKFSKKFNGKNIITETKLKNIFEFCNFRNLMRGNILNELFYENSQKELGKSFPETKLFNIENKRIFKIKTCLTCFHANSIFFIKFTLASIDRSNRNFFKKFVYFLKKKICFSRNYLVDEAIIIINKTYRLNITNKVQDLLPI